MRKCWATSVNKNDLNKGWATYHKLVYAVAEAMFESKVKPYLQKHGYDFLAGNGTFWIGYDDPDNRYGFVSIDIDKEIPKRIRDILFMEVPGFRANDLGSLMPDYTHNKKEPE